MRRRGAGNRLANLQQLWGISPKSVRKIVEVEHYIDQYALYVDARNVGIKFSPNDLTVDQAKIFKIIKEAVEEDGKR